MANHGHEKTNKKTMKNELNPGQFPVSNNSPIALPTAGQMEIRPQPAVPLPEPLAYDINQSAAALNMSTKSVRRLLRRGKLTCCKALRKILIPRKQIEEFFKANCDTPKLHY
jgi:hypothetical protein